MTTKPALEFLADYLQRTNLLLENYLNEKTKEAFEIGKVPGESVKRFSDMALLGKRVRGALMVLSYLTCGGRDEEEIYKTSLFYEIFSTGVLVQDDVIDNSEKRRGLPSLHKQYENLGKTNGIKKNSRFGEALANCIGDYAFFTGFNLLLSSNFPEKNKNKAAELFTYYISRLALGQIADVSNTDIQKATEEEILEMMKIKTGEYTALLPLLLGAELALENDAQKIEVLKKYGEAFGWVYQIQDDILGLFGDEEKTGKSVISDLTEGKITLFMLYLWKMGTEGQKKRQKEILGNKNLTKSDVLEMQKMVKVSGAYDRIINMKEKYLRDGMNRIDMISGDQKYRDLFASFLQLASERDK